MAGIADRAQQSRTRAADKSVPAPVHARFSAFGVLAERCAPSFAKMPFASKPETAPSKPHAAMALFADRGLAGGHGGAHASDDRNDRYQRIKDQLELDAQGLDAREVDLAQDVNRKIGHALLARFEAQTIDSFLAIAFWIFLGAFIFSLGMLVIRTAADAATAPFGIGAVHSLLGVALAAVMRAMFNQSAMAAISEFRGAERALVILVGETTNRLRDQLVELRARMQTGGNAPDALSAAADARLLTATALRFFAQAPLVSVVEGEGHACHNVHGALLGAAKRSEAAAWRIGVMLFSALGGAALGAVLLLASADMIAFAPLPAIVTQILEVERANRGAISYLLLIVSVLISMPVFGLIAAQTAAISNPAGVMRREPSRGLANSVRLKALEAAAESRREFIERYADAVVSLESRASGWGGASHHKATHAAAELETPYWRRAPEGPRFVAPDFHAAPKAFLAGQDGVGGGGASAPKRGLWSRLKSPGL